MPYLTWSNHPALQTDFYLENWYSRRSNVARLEETAQAFVVRNGQLMNGFRDVCVIFQPEKVGHPSRLAVCFLLLNTQIGRQMEKWHRSWCGNDSECVRAVEIWSIFFFSAGHCFPYEWHFPLGQTNGHLAIDRWIFWRSSSADQRPLNKASTNWSYWKKRRKKKVSPGTWQSFQGPRSRSEIDATTFHLSITGACVCVQCGEWQINFTHSNFNSFIYYGCCWWPRTF